MTYTEGSKNFEVCPMYFTEQASPTHILVCLGHSMQDLTVNPLLVLDFVRVQCHGPDIPLLGFRDEQQQCY